MPEYCFYEDSLPEWGIDQITVAEDYASGDLYFPVKVLCEALALDRGAATAFLKADSRTKPGVQDIRVPSRGGPQKTVCVRRKELAIWLAVMDPRTVGTRAKARGKLQEFQAALWQLADRVIFRGKAGADASAMRAAVVSTIEGTQRSQTHCPDCGAPLLAEMEQGTVRLTRRQ